MKFFVVICLASFLLLASCAGLNGEAAGSRHGASARSDVFRIPLP